MTQIDHLLSTTAHTCARFWTDERGATAIEYAMIASGVGIAIAATVFTLGSRVNSLFTTLAGLL